LLDRFDWNALVGRAVKAEDRRLQLGRNIDRVAWRGLALLTDKPTVPSDSCLEAWVVGCVKPSDAPAPAKARYGEAVSVRFTRCRGMRDGRVEVAHDLLVRHLSDN